MTRNEERKMHNTNCPDFTYYFNDTNEGRGIVSNYNYAMKKDNYSLDCVYGSYSVFKAQAERYCRELCRKYNGYDFRIASYNTMQFTVTFKFIEPVTGEIMIAYITRSYNKCTSAI